MQVGCDCLPFHRVAAVADDPGNSPRDSGNADVAVKDIAWPAVLRSLMQGRSPPCCDSPAKDLAAFPRESSPAVRWFPQVAHIPPRIVVGERTTACRLPCRVYVPTTRIRQHRCHQCGRSPNRNANIRVVQAVLSALRRRSLRVRPLNPPVQRRILHVGVQLARALCPTEYGGFPMITLIGVASCRKIRALLYGNMIASIESPASEIFERRLSAPSRGTAHMLRRRRSCPPKHGRSTRCLPRRCSTPAA